MGYRISYKQSVARDLARLDSQTQRRILDKIDAELTGDPLRHPGLKGPYAGLYRLRVGDYRVIYTVLEEEVPVLRIGHRREIYR
ncbi:MAG: type II toxin-antitoxin system RelE/ParE family toxin [Candidatus Neomarinimicrobiota bacterium]